jgi:hypothetical protein
MMQLKSYPSGLSCRLLIRRFPFRKAVFHAKGTELLYAVGYQQGTKCPISS